MVESFYQNPMAKIADNLIWIIGQGGLLGSGIRTQLSLHTKTWTLWEPNTVFSWKSPALLKKQSDTALRAFCEASLNHSRWTIVWASGSGVIGTDATELTIETHNFSYFIDLLSQIFKHKFDRGSFFFASSAGGVWGGSNTFPITEATAPSAISEYGKQKLAQERILTTLVESQPHFRLLIGRISNLYGPGQNLSKNQGLLSQLCRSALLRIPMNIFVPLTTIRDYIHSCDAAELILRSLEKIAETPYSKALTTKIICSEEDSSISQILNYLHHLTHHEPVISFPENKISNQHPTELVFRSRVLPDSYRCRLLLQGIDELLSFQENQLQLGKLPFPEAV